MQLRFSRSQLERALLHLRNREIPVEILEKWRSDAEFDLSKDASSKLTFVSGPDSYHEFKLNVTFEERKFVSIWDLEETETGYTVLDLSLIEIQPKLAKNKK